MNEIANKFLLTGDKFMPEMHLTQPGFTYSACGPFRKNKERIEKFKETGDSRYIYRDELDKSCDQHNMAYGDFKNLAKITASDKVLRDKSFNIAKNPKYDECQRGLASMVYKFLIKRLLVEQLNLYQMNNLQMNFINQLLKNLKKEKFILQLKIVFGVLILQIYNQYAILIKEFVFYYVLLIFLVNSPGLFL